MSVRPASAQVESHRARTLRALGITPWLRRAGGNQDALTVPATGPEPKPSCVVLLPDGCPPRELDLIGRALATCGAELARAGRILVRDGRPVAEVPPVRAYLVFGQAQAHALGRELPAAVANQAQIVLADEPSALLTSGAAKRRLWTALRQLRRALAVSGGA